MSTINNNSNNTRPATYFTYDHFGKKIVGSELNFKKSGNPNNPQYAALMKAMADHPTYSFAPVAPKVKKQTYAGLNAALITEYVELFGTEAQKAELNPIHFCDGLSHSWLWLVGLLFSVDGDLTSLDSITL